MDLKFRAEEQELMDMPGFDDHDLETAYRFMRFVNKFFGGMAPVRDFIKKACMETGITKFKILDLGSGICDIPVAVSHWAKANGIHTRWTCLEISETACKIGRNYIIRNNAKEIQLVHTNIFNYQPDQTFDLAVGSMFFHHFDNDSIIAIGRKIREFGCKRLLINDLYRSKLNYYSCSAISFLLSPKIKHDALISITKGFRQAELHDLLKNMTPRKIETDTSWYCRITGTAVWQ